VCRWCQCEAEWVEDLRAKRRAAWLKGALREVRLDSNPLRRTCDRVETWLLIILCAAFLAGAPATAAIAGGYVYDAGVRAARVSHQVTAILLADARSLYANGQKASAPARWTGPDGRVGWGRVHAAAGTRAGSSVRAWVDRAGRLVGAPARGADLARSVAGAAAFAAAALAVLLAGAALMSSRVLRRRRLAAWEVEWRSVEPGWTGRSEP
jgi:hypothetical protein